MKQVGSHWRLSRRRVEQESSLADDLRRRTRRRRASLQEEMIFPFWLLAILVLSSSIFSQQTEGAGTRSQAIESVLLDTTEQSLLGWTKYPDGGTRTHGWVEESFIKFEEPERGINWRSFVVCDVDHNSVNNWLWTPFIERGQANRLYIEIKFTMRDCNLFPQRVLSCKETFGLLYKEADVDLLAGGAANASFAQAQDYQLIDAIAADEGRFTSNTDVVINTELRSVPTTKRGLYFAFRDQGACLSLISIRVYSLRCPELTSQLAHFNATPTGRDLTSLVAVEGECVPNAVQLEQPRMFCTADGQWNSMSAGACRCAPGFEAAHNGSRCQACPPGRFRWAPGDLGCQACPEHSAAPQPGAQECRCLEGYYRAPRDPRPAPCTQPPGPPTNLSLVYADSGALVLQWQPPRFTGGRDDLSYKLTCEGCEQTMVASPQFLANFSETKCVIAGLSAGTAYRLTVQAVNGVSAQAPTIQAASQELLVQTARLATPSPGNALASVTGQPLPVYNFRALQGARSTDMVLAWDSSDSQPSPAELLAAPEPQPPVLFEVRYQARFQLESRSPYPASMTLQDPPGPQSVTTANRALALTSLAPHTEYAFQIRAKWTHSAHWTPFSEPILKQTSSQPAPLIPAGTPTGEFLEFVQQQQQRPAFLVPAIQPAGPTAPGQSASWMASLTGLLLCALVALGLLSLGLVHYRKSVCLRSLAGFGQLGTGSGTGGSTYGAVYGSGASSDLIGTFGSPLAAHLNGHHVHHQTLGHLHQPQLSSSGLISGQNGHTPRSGAAHAVQSFIAATLGQIGAGQAHRKGAAAATMGHQKLFAPSSGPHGQQRNHYHQTLSSMNHTMLLSQPGGQVSLSAGGQQQQQQPAQPLVGQQLQQQQELLKYRALTQPGAPFMQPVDPQLHIYDDLDTSGSQKEIEPQRVSVDSVLARGDFGQLCTGLLRSALTGAESRVGIKTLRPQANDRARLEFLVEALLLSQFNHPNIVRLEALVTRSEPMMIVTELMEKGPLDAYLRDNKNRFTCLQLISMLRGVANGMQYLAKLNFVHKDLAARNILVNDQNVCKIADFGFWGAQQVEGDTEYQGAADSSPSGSQATAAGQLQALAEQLVQQRFSPQGQQVAANAKIPVRWTAIEAIAFRRFTLASDVWSFGVLAWEVMSAGERPYWSWSNQDVIKAVEQGYRLPQPENCPEPLYKLMLDCWLKERTARPTFSQIVKQLDRLLSPYDDPFGRPLAGTNNQQEPVYYDTNYAHQLAEALELDQWLDSIKMSRYKENFERHQLSSLRQLARLNQDDLSLIGIPSGQHQRRLMAAIAGLRSSVGQPAEGYLV